MERALGKGRGEAGPPRGLAVHRGRRRGRRHSHRGGKCLHRGVHRHRLYAGHVRGAQRHRQYDHERGEPHCAAGVRDGGRARGNALRRVQGIHDAAG